jgi:uncharacterized phage protein gp47/JayE
MTYQNGEVIVRSDEEWLNIILEAGSDYWGEDIVERDNTSIHQFYEPFAAGLSELEGELQEIIQALRIETAERGELDIIGQRLGVTRIPPRKSVGEVTLSRSTDASKDYIIQSGTVVQTDGQDEIQFQTTEQALLESGTQSVTTPIEALDKGSRGNVASGSIRDAPLSINGVQSINNPNPTTKGRNEELDDAYRARIKNSVGNIEATSGFQLYNELTAKEYVKEIRFIDNSSDANSQNLGPHKAEVVVDAEPGNRDEIAQRIFNNVPMGIDLVSGNYGNAVTGSATLPNGQTFTIPFSEPSEVSIYADVTVETEADIAAERIKDAIVQYIGGTKFNGEQVYGDLSVGDDVVYGEVEYAVRSLPAVYDVPSLEIGTSSSPTGTSNITISTSERPNIIASNITVTKQ